MSKITVKLQRQSSSTDNDTVLATWSGGEQKGKKISEWKYQWRYIYKGSSTPTNSSESTTTQHQATTSADTSCKKMQLRVRVHHKWTEKVAKKNSKGEVQKYTKGKNKGKVIYENKEKDSWGDWTGWRPAGGFANPAIANKKAKDKAEADAAAKEAREQADKDKEDAEKQAAAEAAEAAAAALEESYRAPSDPSLTAEVTGHSDGVTQVTLAWGAKSSGDPESVLEVSRVLNGGEFGGALKDLILMGQPYDDDEHSYADALEDGSRVRYRAVAISIASMANETWGVSGSAYTDWVEAYPIAPGQTSEPTANDSGDGCICHLERYGEVGSKWCVAWTADSATAAQAEPWDWGNSTSVESSATSCNVPVTGLEAGKSYDIAAWLENSAGLRSDATVLATGFAAGTTAGPPTIWPLDMAYIAGEAMTIGWTHNPTDGSAQTAWSMRVLRDGSVVSETTAYASETAAGAASSATWTPTETGAYTVSVRTAGCNGEFSEWATSAEFHVVERPTCTVTCDDPVTAMPLSLSLSARAAGQSIVAAGLEIAAVDAYDTDRPWDEDVGVAEGEVLWSDSWEVQRKATVVPGKYTTLPVAGSRSSYRVTVPVGVSDVPRIADGQTYEVTATVRTSYNMEATSTFRFTVAWAETAGFVAINARRSGDALSAGIQVAYYASGSISEDGEISSDAVLGNAAISLWREDSDGGWELAVSDVPNGGSWWLVDPLPRSGRQRYLAVAQLESGPQAWDYDIAEGEFGCVELAWGGDMPPAVMDSGSLEGEFPEHDSILGGADHVEYWHNIDIEEKSDPDVSHQAYIGNSDPTALHGTQTGRTYAISCDVADDGSEHADGQSEFDWQLSQARKLRKVGEDVHVRTPSGLSFWATVVPSSIGTPVRGIASLSFDATRVEH